MYSFDKNINNIMISLNRDLLFYQTGFITTLWSSILINAPLCYLALRINFKQILYRTVFLLKTAKKKKYCKSLLIANLTFPRILLALPKRWIYNSMPLPEYKNILLQSKSLHKILFYKISIELRSSNLDVLFKQSSS